MRMPSITPLSSHPQLQNISIIILTAFLFPFLTTLTLLSTFISPWLPTTKHISHTRRWRAISSSTFRARSILITDLRTPEALSLARAFYQAGHMVIGADYEEYFFPIPAHFSKSVDVFYRLGNVGGKNGRERYVRDLVDVVRKEGVELWVNCSNSNMDVEARGILERGTGCKVLQFGKSVRELLGNESISREHINTLGLNIAERHLIASEDEAFAILYPEKSSSQGKQYTITSAHPADTSNSEMALLPLSSQNDIRIYIRTLQPSSSHPLLLQEAFPDHEQYTAYALFTHGKPAAFVVYPTSTQILTPLLSMSLLAQALLQYTKHLFSSFPASQAEKNGHITFHFTIPSTVAIPAESRYDASSSIIKSFLPRVHLLACTPNLDLGTLTLTDVAEDLASAYLSILPDHEPNGINNGHLGNQIIVPRPGVRGHYFLETELVRLVCVPIWAFLRWGIGTRELLKGWFEFVAFVVWWREAWWEDWDPWVAWWRYGGYAVGKAMIRIWENGGGEDALMERA